MITTYRTDRVVNVRICIIRPLNRLFVPAQIGTQHTKVTRSNSTRWSTGHADLDRFGLVHIDGRIFDREIGRLLSPDPLLPSPYQSRTRNR